MPLYNKGAYVARALRSVLGQEFADFEVIVINDGSTDDGPDRVAAFNDERVKIFTQVNQGVSAARNKGAELASGDWLAFLDADDFWSERHLSELFRLINTFHTAGMVASSYRQVAEGGDISFLNDVYCGELREINYFHEAQKQIGVINSSNVAIKKDVFDTVGGFAGYRYGEDLEMWARVALSYPVARSTFITVVYYRGAGGAMQHIEQTRLEFFPAVNSLADVSPSVATLIAGLDNISTQSEMRLSVIGYINSRLIQAMRSAFIMRDVNRLKKLRTFVLRPYNFRVLCWLFFSSFPKPLLSLVSSLRALLKRLYLKTGR